MLFSITQEDGTVQNMIDKGIIHESGFLNHNNYSKNYVQQGHETKLTICSTNNYSTRTTLIKKVIKLIEHGLVCMYIINMSWNNYVLLENKCTKCIKKKPT